MNASNPIVSNELTKLDQILEGCEELLIIVHNNPDPDAIASAMALGYFVEKRYQIRTSIAYGGNIGRSENRSMVNKLKVKMKQIGRIRFAKYDRIALVDTQPGAGNNALPAEIKCHIVIDHHPPPRPINADLIVVKPEIGVCASILIEWLNQSEIEINADLATALSYAIISETQNLGREASQRDIQAYLSVYVKSSIRKLAQIINPKLPHPHFVTLEKTLHKAVTYRNLICAHLGAVPSAEIVAEMADFLLRHQNISWSFCTGRFKKNMFLSLRSSNQKAKAGMLIKHLVDNPKNVGGHGMLAGGYIPLNSNKREELHQLEIQLSHKFTNLMGYHNVDWKPLINHSQKSLTRSKNDR